MNVFVKASTQALPEIVKKSTMDNYFHSRPTDKEIKNIPSVFLPLDNGPVLVMPKIEKTLIPANTDRHCNTKHADGIMKSKYKKK